MIYGQCGLKSKTNIDVLYVNKSPENTFGIDIRF